MQDKSTADSYHKNADPERAAARRLADSLEPWRYTVPKGPILEVGTGTGLFTQHLRRIFPNRDILASDNSDLMIKRARSELGISNDNNSKVEFSRFDAEEEPIQQQHYALICGNHVAHQFQQPAATLEKLATGLTLDGLMLMSFPGEDSFEEWRSACVDLGLPFTGKTLPGTEPLVIHLSMGPVQVDFYEDQSTWYFTNFQAFLSHMRAGGMAVEKDERQLTNQEINLLTENWKRKKDETIGLTYHNVFLAVKRIGE